MQSIGWYKLKQLRNFIHLLTFKFKYNFKHQNQFWQIND